MCMCEPMTEEQLVAWRAEKAAGQLRALVAAGYSLEQPEQHLRVEARAFYDTSFAKALGILEVPKLWYLHD